MISGLLRMEFPKDRFMGEEDAAARRHAQTPAIGSTRGRLPRLLRARLAALCGLTLPRGEAPRHYLGGGSSELPPRSPVSPCFAACEKADPRLQPRATQPRPRTIQDLRAEPSLCALAQRLCSDFSQGARDAAVDDNLDLPRNLMDEVSQPPPPLRCCPLTAATLNATSMLPVHHHGH